MGKRPGLELLLGLPQDMDLPPPPASRLTRFLVTGSSFIQVGRFLSARSTSFWHKMSSDKSASKTDCGGEREWRMQGSGWGQGREGSRAWDPQESWRQSPEAAQPVPWESTVSGEGLGPHDRWPGLQLLRCSATS